MYILGSSLKFRSKSDHIEISTPLMMVYHVHDGPDTAWLTTQHLRLHCHGASFKHRDTKLQFGLSSAEAKDKNNSNNITHIVNIDNNSHNNYSSSTCKSNSNSTSCKSSSSNSNCNHNSTSTSTSDSIRNSNSCYNNTCE